MILFIALCLIGIAIAGFCAFLIFWPLSLVHLRDRHPQIHQSLGEAAFFSPNALYWLLSMRYRQVGDAAFTGLATPAALALWTTLGALVFSGLMWLWAAFFPEYG
ncbi:hypothetical protein CO613_09910 [Lysobacteraceae bacterium NML07-0707]|nr:hypothetical protein CO613_09910 [Xanthomonadaceae bacterium NML07-0707]